MSFLFLRFSDLINKDFSFRGRGTVIEVMKRWDNEIRNQRGLFLFLQTHPQIKRDRKGNRGILHLLIRKGVRGRLGSSDDDSKLANIISERHRRDKTIGLHSPMNAPWWLQWLLVLVESSSSNLIVDTQFGERLLGGFLIRDFFWKIQPSHTMMKSGVPNFCVVLLALNDLGYYCLFLFYDTQGLNFNDNN